MRVVIVGSGNVATVLGRLIKHAGHEIIQVISRDGEHAKILAKELQCAWGDYGGPLNSNTDLYLIAVKDSALYELNKVFHAGNILVVHTAGSIPKDTLKEVSHNYGVLYPLQSLRKEMDTTADIPLLIDGNTSEATALIEDFARTISDTVSVAGDQERLKLHVAAVIVSNFTNHLYALAEEFCKKEKVDFKMLVPLIRETAERIEHNSPVAVQTGPALRNDVFTLDKHLRLLQAYPKLKYMYLKLTESIMKT
jgi:predicted short-subunit dehydrogenase-like oxidoreductase (DUF2520 family)